MDYNEKRQEIEEALDACGIGRDVQERFRAAEAEISAFLASVSEKIHGNLVHNLLANKPHGIRIEGSAAENAIKSGTISALSALIKWDIGAAEELAGDMLEDVNAHPEAALVRGGAADLIAALEEAAAELKARGEIIGGIITDEPAQAAYAASSRARGGR